MRTRKRLRTLIRKRQNSRRKREIAGGNSLQQQYNACMKHNNSLEERLAKTEDLLLKVLQELNELKQENSELRRENAELHEKLAKTEAKLNIVYHNFYEDKIITSVFDVMKYEKHSKKNPLFKNVIMKNLRNNRHDTNHYILEKDTVELVKKKETYLQEIIQDLLDSNSPMIEHVNDKVYDMSGNTLYDMLSAIKRNVEHNPVTLTPEDRALLDEWWNKS
jgi:chromosome segregation ATPase